MATHSAGILLYRRTETIEVFLVHPGGPLYAKKDEGYWSIPKGEYREGEEDAFEAALRECKEETGHAVSGPRIALTPVATKSGKIIRAWALAGDLDPAQLHSNTFALEWPPRSGKKQQFPEVDRGAWFSLAEAKLKIHNAQTAFVEELEHHLLSM